MDTEARKLTPEQALEAWLDHAPVSQQIFPLGDGAALAVARTAGPDLVRIHLIANMPQPLALHWGLARRFRSEWQLPPKEVHPPGTAVIQQAAETPFAERDGLNYLELEFKKPGRETGPRALKFVLRQGENTWLKNQGADFCLPLFEPAPDSRLPSASLRELGERIVDAEKGASSWTLMHRFHLCHDLLDPALDEHALALLFAWLRYSAIRQLDWQRCYNTKPRELSHAQERLTARVAGLWRSIPAADASRRRWLRLMLTTLGRGGDGQRVRDEILHIMHRNHLKEASGTFVEEWHQKLHNNTTPDDIVICHAYLAFLRSNGDRGGFNEALRAGGISRERLTRFERPIRSDPEFYPDKKDALIGDFENFLRILKSVHAGTDLDTALGAARGRLESSVQQQLDALLKLRPSSPEATALANSVTQGRQSVQPALANARDDAAARDLLFLDLALEDIFRGAIERQNLGQLDRDRLVDLVRLSLKNVQLTAAAPEIGLCAAHWEMLCNRPRQGRDWALHTKSVADRMGRWIQQFTDEIYQELQPKAEFLGASLEVEAWTVPVFGEEVIRGGPAFTLAQLLRPVDPLLRQAAGLGGWQVISPGRAAGRLRSVKRLLDVQGERRSEPTVLVADAVSGSEEIPEGVTAVITRDTPDLVSHVAVRARNAGVLFATCLEPDTYRQLSQHQGQPVALEVTPGGDVVVREAAGTESAPKPITPDVSNNRATRPVGPWSGSWLLPENEFAPGLVGGKSNNLIGLRGKLPDWIHLPRSLALPFGVVEKVLEDPSNRELRRQVEHLIGQAETNPPEVLARIRALLRQISLPDALRQAVTEAWQRLALPPVPEELRWQTIRRVWSSQWNERAYLSRRARGVPHDRLRMAVLIQELVPADYAFVIHTANPLTGNRDELFAEVVLGLGETLVGNYPGRALGFVCKKKDLSLGLFSYPSKSVGLYGHGVIFRSDSNGEDLEGFAGAGLYDSFLAEAPRQRLLDYSRERLVWDQVFRDDLLRGIARVGLEVEKVLGSPQDIEGAASGGRLYVVQTRPQVGVVSGKPAHSYR
jgi:alpha-glucan,water dikinase